MHIECDLQFLGVRTMILKDASTAYEVNFYDVESQQARSFFVGGKDQLIQKVPTKAPCNVHVKIGLVFVPEHRLYRLRLVDIQA